jgi:hypothetical protein
MITHEPWTTQSKPGNGQKPTNTQRRTLIGGAIGGAMAALLSSSGRVMAEETAAPSDPFILLLKGLYQPVIHGPNLGLSAVDLNDRSYSKTKIYPVFGIPGSANHNNHEDNAIGNFYVQFNGDLAAYQIPGGALAMRFTGGGFSSIPYPDGQGGQFLEGTFELTVLQATGIYRPFQGGHNHMVDKLHKLADGRFDEFCFCIISQYQFP